MEMILISAGRGPIECSWVVGKVFEQFSKDAKSNDLSVDLIDSETDSERDCYKSVVCSVDGETADQFINEWVGTIQWVEQSPFRPTHKRKNWFVSFARLKSFTETELSKNEIRFETMRSSGAGGQHVNKTESAVRAIHIPTGISVVVRTQRSQFQNKSSAVTLLMNRVADLNSQNRSTLDRDNWQNHNELIRGNPVKLFRG